MKHNFMWVYIIFTFTYKTDVLELLDWNIRYLDTAVGPSTDLLHVSSLILPMLSFSNFKGGIILL